MRTDCGIIMVTLLLKLSLVFLTGNIQSELTL
nr:MAG TPA: hypothetical protein [Caudoviricetes sp.]